MSETHLKSVEDLNLIIARRTNAIARYEADIHERIKIAESLQFHLREASGQLQNVLLEQQATGDELSLLKAHEEDQNKQIDHLLQLLLEKPQLHYSSSIESVASLSTISPFVIYSSSMPMSRHGFSLMPLNTIVFEHTPISQQPEKVKLKTPSSKKTPKLKTSSKKSPKIVVPKLGMGSKPVLTTPEIPSRLIISPRIPIDPDFDFDRLVPISDDDTTGSLIAYVTRYVNLNSPELKPSLKTLSLTPSPVLISEVPLNLLKLQTPSVVSRPKTGNADRKTRHLEKLLQETSAELAAERERFQESTRHILVLKGQLEKTERKAHMNGLLHNAAKRRLTQALALLSNTDREVLELKKMVHEAEMISSEQTKLPEGPIADDLLAAFTRVSHGLGDMAIHELEAARRWATKKEQYLQQEKKKMVAALDAMQFITQMGDEPETRKSIVVSSVKRQKRLPSPVPDEPCPSADQATVTAAAHLQSLPEMLLRGVISVL
jgi:hypothetical protein